ncbi:histidine phosphatase family protein [Streptomyces sp. NPDC001941]|uniref:histidine phosphatase family protein n=1 Tax=Streptomyces sp. NPDC001941 TaxID=3154659 RepID=UPI0033342DBF
MTVRITLLAPAAGPRGRAPRFGAEEPPEHDPVVPGLPPAERWFTAPGAHCRATALALGPAAEVAPALADADPGDWRGRTLDEVAADDPAGLAAWTTDPDAAPPGGESVTALCRRVGGWLDALPEGRALAVAGPGAVRAAVVHALAVPPDVFWRVDVEPLALTRLTRHSGRWHLRLA